MLTFNAILRHEGIGVKKVRLVRHQYTGGPGRPTPYDLWRANDGRLETYQQIQRRKRFAVGDLLATFVVTPNSDTLFVGLYSVDGVGSVPPGVTDPTQSDLDVTGMNFYDIHRDQRLADYAGHLTVDWGKGFLAWVQYADRHEKAVLEIRKEITEPPFPGFSEFICDVDKDKIAAIPLTWQAVLRSVRGVYLLVCKETGKQYVGSAKSEGGLWQRLLDYAQTGDGGNVELRRRGPRPYQFTVLEVVNSDFGIEKTEEAWKRKLLTREFGLNEN